MSETHYILPITERNGRFQLSACNTWVLETAHHSDPTCLTCRQYLLDDSRELSAEEVFGAFDATKSVQPSFATNADRHMNDYAERRR